LITAPKQLPRQKRHYLAKEELTLAVQPGEVTTTWSDPSFIVQDFTTFPLRIENPGELIYIGTTLHEAVGQTANNDANFSIQAPILGTRNMRFDLRFRRLDANNFIALRVDAPASTVKLVKVVSGTETVLAQASRTFEHLGVHFYTLEIWGFGRFLYGFINHYNILRTSEKFLRTEPGLSLNFPTIDEDDLPAIYHVRARELFAQNKPSSVTDGSDLYLQFRIDIKDQIENPTVKTWATFQHALRLYEQRNVGGPDRLWEERGYPIRKPTAEEWFAD